ncbi:F-BAR domain only protein 2 isoform X13 [Salmo salar]|uniref:F-BAR domain only protein 2 n=1 Tax=Salmo salar TaxID=8030 RepID=A0ABM3CPU4_SALSA|nr:F-BAR domain only protein 2-like isoform X13 [Salmo salar]|eukprot:XP_013996606.1 PREDICTED: F-BAR domain only protein 2-like isoform X13 [Salmo salar]
MITPYFLQNFWGEKNNGFDVLYHNMKHGQISSKELTEFIRERATIEEVYARSMTKLAKSAGNFSQLGTFAPVWDVFKTSTEKLASCHLELVRKLQELIKDVQKYVDDQAKAHKKTKEEVASTLESVQTIQTTGVALQKSKENYNAKTVEQERLRKEGATQRDVDKAGVKAKKATETYKSFVEKYATAKSEFEQKMAETAQKFQDIEESHIVHMKDIIQSYTQSVDETHVQIGEVRIEFERNMENTSVEGLIQKLADSKGTGKERPGPIEFEECNAAIATEGAKPRKRKTFAIPGRRKDNKDTDSTESTEVEPANNANGVPPGYYGTIDFQNANVPTVDEDGFCIRPEDRNQNDAKENSFYSSSDSEDEDEPRKFRVEIKPVAPNNRTQQSRATIDQLKASIGNISLSPPTSGQMRRNQSRLSGMHSHSAIGSQVLGDELGKARMSTYFNEPALNNDLLSLDPFGPAPTLRGSSSSVSSSTVPALARPTTPQTGAMVAPPRPSSRPKLPTGKLTGINEIVRPFSPTKTLSNASPPPAAPLARAESSSSLSSTASLSASNTPTVGPERIFRPSLSSPEPEFLLSPCPLLLLSQKDDGFIGKLPTFEKCCETPSGTSRGPSPVTLASQDALPIAVAFTESVNAYFKGADPAKCIVKITGDMTLSFPMGIIKVFTSNPSPAMLTFKLKNTSKLEQILPNQTLLFSDPSQSDAHTKDFWFNMQALTSYLRKASEQNPAASYHNVDILKYQVSSKGIASTPLNLAVYWKCDPATTDLRLDYHYNPESMLCPGPLSNVQVLVPVDGGVTNMQSLPNAIWNSELNKSLWKLSDISEKSDNEGSGSLRAKFELSDGPSTPTTLAVQFMSEGSTLSGVDIELLGTGYRLSLNKKRFATGRYMADC